jgi:ABC-type nitrate/sulfonate/bicarbonate transport system ATPase subunit
MSFVTIDRASFTYRDGEAVVDKVNWTIAEGEFHCLVGRSGCGKTTLLKIAAGLLSPTEGSIHIQGKEVQEPKEEIGFVFQTPTLLEWLSVQHAADDELADTELGHGGARGPSEIVRGEALEPHVFEILMQCTGNGHRRNWAI